MLPFTAAWPALATRYVRWLHEKKRKGWSFDAAEVRIDMPQVDGAALRLHGRIDRIDRRHGGAAVRLIDYKTNSKEALRSKVRQPLEDTQLAVYAALQSAHDEGRHGCKPATWRSTTTKRCAKSNIPTCRAQRAARWCTS